MAGQLWRVVNLYRAVTLAYAAVLIVRGDHGYARPAAGLAALAAMAVWSAVTFAAYRRPPGRSRWMLGADLAVTAALVVSTRFIDTAAHVNAGASTLTVSWAASPVLACAVAGGPWGGLAGALVISVTDFAERQTLLAANTFSNVVLLLIAGGIGGWVVSLGLRAEAAIERAARQEATAGERERLARGIHDSVLQVLALVASRGKALGGEAAELGRMAGDQEAALRALLTTDPGSREGETIDLRNALESHACDSVTVACPATPVPLPAMAADAITAAVAAALDNTRRHAGPSARSWILAEDEGWQVRVLVRDDGAGFPAGRLDRAAAEGRLGVSQSIIGRIRDAGGTARVTSSPGEGTEVELNVPRPGRSSA